MSNIKPTKVYIESQIRVLLFAMVNTFVFFENYAVTSKTTISNRVYKILTHERYGLVNVECDLTYIILNDLWK